MASESDVVIINEVRVTLFPKFIWEIFRYDKNEVHFEETHPGYWNIMYTQLNKFYFVYWYSSLS